MRLDIKAHIPPDHGRIIRYFRQDDYGFIDIGDGREIYFHRNNVADENFPRLEVGDEVRFVEVEGKKEPQASSVVPTGKHHCEQPGEA